MHCWRDSGDVSELNLLASHSTMSWPSFRGSADTTQENMLEPTDECFLLNLVRLVGIGRHTSVALPGYVLRQLGWIWWVKLHIEGQI